MIFYFIIKYCLYTVVCTTAPHFLKIKVDSIYRFAAIWGAIRLSLELVAGFFMLNFYALFESMIGSSIFAFILTFGLLRYLEWLLIVVIISQKYKRTCYGRGTQLWIALGVLSSLLIDTITLIFIPLGSMTFVC
ncbi:hypothetical protein [Algicola sagamiensis]|uniref:hypothetical protein n=1 Tax=Algicola sagamiensis TaxID=163869 RepID=UPI0003796822|nr:hypothetical protein [Algicola sagamiensis]